VTDHVPHVWVQVEPVPIAGGRLLVSSDVVCARCGTRLAADHAPRVDRIEGYRDCHEILAIVVMET